MTCFILSHKDYNFPHSDYYQVVGLGGFRSDRVILSDADSWNNISELNKYFCELTGIYYVWRNTDENVTSVCHYRRYFNLLPLADGLSGWINTDMNENLIKVLDHPLQKERAESLLKSYDLILPKAFYSPVSIGDDYMKAHGNLEWDIFVSVLDEYYGPDSHALRTERRNFYCNMLICKRSIFDLYCAQLFTVINRVFSKVGIMNEIAGVRYQPYRYPGYLAERFMSAFINANKLSYYEADVVVTS